MSNPVLKGLERFGEKPGLERIDFLLHALGRPETAFPAVQIAGTNGKGSTAATVAAVLQAAGYTVGSFTSPHLERYNERIVVNGEQISDAELDDVLAALQPSIDAAARTPGVGQPTEFEVGTAAAFVYFARRRVDVAVVEVGLGGRYDSTNVVHPVASVITPIGLDHTNRLGSTTAAIAADKAGIMRRGVPVVIGPQTEAVTSVLVAAAEEHGAPYYTTPGDYAATDVFPGTDGTRFTFRFRAREMVGMGTPLLGGHQADNGATALAALHVMAQRGWDISKEAMREGLARVVWPGRLELISRRPATLLDGAHNEEAAAALAATLKTLFPGRPIVFVLGFLAEKPVGAILARLLPLARRVIFTAPSEGRTAVVPPARLADMVRHVPLPVDVEPDGERAVVRAREAAGAEGVVCVAGSLYLVGEIRRRFVSKAGVDRWEGE